MKFVLFLSDGVHPFNLTDHEGLSTSVSQQGKDENYNSKPLMHFTISIDKRKLVA